MYEYVGYILGAVFVIMGISYQFLHDDKLVLKEKLKPGKSFEAEVKKARGFGVSFIFAGALMIIIRYFFIK